jgi:site-specific recombinase XerD
VELFRKKNSQYYWYDFAFRGRRYRGSTNETNKNRAGSIAAIKLAEVMESKVVLPRKAPRLADFSRRFLEWVKDSKLEAASKDYYTDGWRLLEATPITGMRLDAITADEVGVLQFTGSPSTTNRALRTLRRMLHKAEEWRIIGVAPRIKLLKEYGRNLRLDDQSEKQLLAAADELREEGTWNERRRRLFEDVVILMRDTGMRNERELYRVRIENINWKDKVIFVPDSKTPDGRRLVPMSERVISVLQARCGTQRAGWVFPSKRAKSGHRTTMAKLFREARSKAGLPDTLVLYCGRHDYGTRVLKRTGNLAAVMKTMGHKDVKTAMQYQHPELDIVRAALNQPEEAGEEAGK